MELLACSPIRPRSWPGPPRRTSTSRSTSIPRIANEDPLYAQAQDIAGNTLSDNGTEAVWDWGNVAQAESYFDTADPTQNAVSETWLDWCCDASGVSAPGVTPDGGSTT